PMSIHDLEPPKEDDKRNPRFRLVPFRAPQYLIKRLIPRVGLVVIWGPPKCGKSFFAFTINMHVAIAEAYREHKVKPAIAEAYRERKVLPGPVVYCAFEGAEGFKLRAEAFRREHKITDVPFFLMPARMNMVTDHADLIASIDMQIGNCKPVAVTLDTLNRSMPGSESSDEDMGNYIKAADAIREAFDCVVIIVHHCGIDDKRPRGHTSLTGAVEAQIAVKRDVANNVIATVEWMKDGPGEGDSIVSRLKVVEIGTDDDGDPMTTCLLIPSQDAAPAKAKKRPTGKTKIALDQLERAIVDAGQNASVSNHIPAGKQVVQVDLWRRYYYAGSIDDDGKQDRKRKSFTRASTKLRADGHIGKWNEWVWIA